MYYYATCLFSNIHSAGVHFILSLTTGTNFKLAMCRSADIIFLLMHPCSNIYVITFKAKPLRDKILLITKEQHS